MDKREQEDLFDPVAVIGLSGRFPKCRDTEEFWRQLRNGEEMISFFDDEELVSEGVSPLLLNNPDYVKAKGVLEDIELFDARFFNFNPREAELTDPQHRNFLECAWEALESAGHLPESIEGAVGVYAGMSQSAYVLNLYSHPDLFDSARSLMAIGNAMDHLATRVSYKLNLRGPSLTVQTACSTSLVAVCLACQSLTDYQCDMALAGGISITLPKKKGYIFQEGGIHSFDGHCRAFDAQANGTVAGNGVGVVVLKRLADALADGDEIHAVIKGWALNNDGGMKIGYTAPSIEGQAEVIAAAQSMAGVRGNDITYVEAHGTGTALGDPIEVAALTKAFRETTDQKGFCAIGSVKSNIGHLDAAAGVAGLIKTVLALKHRQLPPSLHFDRPNPQIDFASSPFYVNHRLSPWPAPHGKPRRAGVSSFGVGGTNAHLVLEEAPAQAAGGASRAAQALVVSARSHAALERQLRRLSERMQEAEPELDLADVAYTLAVGRRRFEFRAALVASNPREAVAELERRGAALATAGELASGGERRRVVFMFPGQGSQYVNMGLGLYKGEAVFRRELDDCLEQLRRQTGRDWHSLLYPAAGGEAEAEQRLQETQLTQPLLYAVEYALARQLQSWGIKAEAMIGHSLGEYVAATLCGVMSVEQGLRLVRVRGELMQEMGRGAMAVVREGEEGVRRRLAGRRLWVAAVNGPEESVVSGEEREVEELLCELRREGKVGKRLEVSHGYHSGMMEEAARRFEQEVRKEELGRVKGRYISGVSGRWMGEGEGQEAGYWRKQMREAVRFGEGLEELLKLEDVLLLEVGPGNSLGALAKRILGKERAQSAISLLPPAGYGGCEQEFFCRSLGQAWVSGMEVDWAAYYRNESRRRVALPGCPFERERYWIDAKSEAPTEKTAPESWQKKANISDWLYAPVWNQVIPHSYRKPEQAVWLFFADEHGVGAALGEKLKEGGSEIISVAPGAVFKRVNENLYIIDPTNPEDYSRLLSELRSTGRIPARIVHLWSVGEILSTYCVIPSENLAREFESGFYSLLFLGKALGGQSGEDSIHIDVISSNAQFVTGSERMSPAHAAILAPCAVIPQEFPHLTCRGIDIDLQELQAGGGQQVVAQLLAELSSPQRQEVVAFRGGRKWIRRFEPLGSESANSQTPYLREGGVYLITGGLGGIGLTLAEHFARAARVTIVLVAHTLFPPAQEWERRIADNRETNELKNKLLRLYGIQQAGATVEVITADVSDRAQMQGVVELARERFGELSGVVHAAGIPASKVLLSLQETGKADCEKQFESKIRGALVLDEVTRGLKLDFVLLISSLSTVVGGVGLVGYTAAHLFIDGLAHSLSRSSGVRWVSVNCDNWRTSEAVDSSPNPTESDASRGALYMTRSEGAEAIDLVLSGPSIPQVAVSTGNLTARIERGSETGRKAEQRERQARFLYQRPDLQVNYVAPRNEREQTLARIWQESLGIQQVGIHDNFFDLGGDSVIGIQITARANQAGLRLNNKQVIEHQTIAELAAVAGSEAQVVAEQGIVTGKTPLTPIQRWLFERDPIDLHHFNQSSMFGARQRLEPDLIEEAVNQLILHHDALRMRYVKVADGWEQYNGPPEPETSFTRIDLSALPETGLSGAIEAAAAEIQASLNLREGPLARVVLLDLGPQRTERLLIVIHHLVVDAVSWRVLLGDLQTAYQQLRRGERVKLPAKTTSFKRWAEGLLEHARSQSVKEELPYWLAQAQEAAGSLPTDHRTGENSVASMRSVKVSIDADRTRVLLQDIPSSFRAQLSDLLLTALTQTLCEWAESRAILLDLEGHGREPLFGSHDVTRTVGWFTTIYPIRLKLVAGSTPIDDLRAIKEQLRLAPNRGFGYGLLRYMNDDPDVAGKLRALNAAQVSFLHLGQFDHAPGGPSSFVPVGEATGPTQSLRAHRAHWLEIITRVSGGRLEVNWAYSENLHRRATIARLADQLIVRLESLIEHFQSSGERLYTPSDFPEAGLTQVELDRLIAELPGL